MLKSMRKRLFVGIIILSIYLAVPCIITLMVTGIVDENVSDEIINGRRVEVKYNNATKSVEVNKFIIMVLADKLPQSSEIEVIKAESIMIRTDIYRMMGDDYSISSDKLGMSYITERGMKSQWGSQFEEKYNLLADCVAATNGTVILYNDKLIEAKMQASSNGKTLSGSQCLGDEYAYLSEVECPGDIKSPDFLQVKTFSNKEFVKKIQSRYKDVGLDEKNPMSGIQIVSKTDSGYVLKIQVGNVVMSGASFAGIMQINSSCLTIEKADSGIKITTKGCGDGFGVSIFHADEMAKEGSSYEDILKKFYSGITLVSQ